ncbi:hypothetical protein PS862_04463 [Pseudomonas fluorescens]|uniref:DUF1097 domain-containing protein n=1 Tax=Pseudomonas fluorescens TaxID=294 RepID=A0A5E7N6S9_PSEFL|nr:hypothetical protein [Pseudomonas fluorescens]VVM96054.1 hypothetical protein PS639_03031 [Pseudomonas fluorescens]VVP32821.1 hypothetical protein PS862_04463 [Pseudomonas fluorescens]
MSTSNTKVSAKVLFDSLVLVAWIVGVAVIGLMLGFKELWPPFFCAILFTVCQKDAKQIPKIIAGGVTGVWLAYGIVWTIGALTPWLGHLTATGVVLLCGLYLIFCGGMLVPLFINLNAFVFLAVALSVHVTEPPVESSLLLVVGGGILLAGEVVLLKLLARRTSKVPVAGVDSAA